MFPNSYPGASLAASTLQSSVSPVQDLYDQIGIQFSAVDVVTEFETTISTATLESALQGFGSLKTCTRTVLGDNDMFGILDIYHRSNLWDEMISNSTLSDLADMMITYEPALFMQSAVELNTNRAIDLFSNLPVTYHITDYLNAIINYVPFGSSYFTNIVNQLIGLGHAAGNWEYSASEHHIYGSSRVGVHQTNLLTRARYNQGDICITLEDVEYTSLYRGKRHYELSNHLGNVQVVVSDKRISVCDSELEVEYFKAEVLSAMDYYPFGMMMPDRQWYANSDSSIAVNGFNGMRNDHEINGHGNALDFGARIYDSRLGRWLSGDPDFKSYPSQSIYAYVGNSPIIHKEIGGSHYEVVIDYDNKTITIIQTFYTLSELTYQQALAAASLWNSQTGTSNGFTVNFNINVVPPVNVTPEEVFEAYPDVDFHRKSGRVNQKTFRKYESYLIKQKSMTRALFDLNGVANVYYGTDHRLSTFIYHIGSGEPEEFVAGVAAESQSIIMNYHELLGDQGKDENLVAHEMGHTMGLEDKGRKYFVPGGIMDYYVVRIGPQDIDMLIQGMFDSLNGINEKTIPVKVQFRVCGSPQPSEPIDNNSNPNQVELILDN